MSNFSITTSGDVLVISSGNPSTAKKNKPTTKSEYHPFDLRKNIQLLKNTAPDAEQKLFAAVLGGNSSAIESTKDAAYKSEGYVPKKGGSAGHKWGKEGILETYREYMDVNGFDEQLGMRELRAKVNGLAGMTDDFLSNRLFISAELNHGDHSVEIVRAYLDSGALIRLLEADLWKDDRHWKPADGHKYVTLGACIMSVGAKMPARMKQELSKRMIPAHLKKIQDKWPTFVRSSIANNQFKQALEVYKEGEPYQWGNKTFLEEFVGHIVGGKQKGSRVTNLGGLKSVTTTLLNGKKCLQSIGPATDEELGLAPIHAAHVCAHCGREDEEGKRLDVCAACGDRRYCNKECQKAHWKLHKIICSIPKDQMDAFLNTIPMDAITSDALNQPEWLKKAMTASLASPSVGRGAKEGMGKA